jgi:uncharacterized protein (TIGR03382 family)
LSGTSFADDLNLASGTRYYYVVRATETSAATVEETNTVEKSATPTGAAIPGLNYFDDLDSSRPPNASSYWIPQTLSGTSGTMNIVSGCHYQSATRAYRYGAANTTCGGTYPASTQALLSLGGNGTIAGINGFAIPASATTAQLTFSIWYMMETRFDGAWLLYSTDSATGPWTQVPDSASATLPYISAGGYDNTLSSNSAIRIWTGTGGGANGALKPVTVNLNALTGRTVWFAYRFSNDSIVHQEGFYVDDVRITSDAYGSCTTNTPPPGPAVTYRVSGLPATSPAGSVATFTVTALDAVGQTATGYSGTASFTSTDPQAVLPPTTAFTAGVASNLPVEFRTVGTRSITATDTVTPSITGSGSTSVTGGPATALVFTVQPSDTVAGVSITPAMRVGLVDQFGNPVTTGTNSVTVALGNNPGGSTLSGTTTVAMISGVATFSGLSLDKTGTGYTLTADSAGLTRATSTGFRINPAAAAKLAFRTQPSNSTAGTFITPAVQVALLDAFDNDTASTANVTVALASNPAGGTLAGTTTVAAVSGIATFGNLSIARVGTGYTLAASSTSLTGATSSAFDITPNVPYRVIITQQPSDIIAGGTMTPPVQASLYDRYGNAVTAATNAVTVSLGNNPSGGTLSGTTTVNAVGGVASFANLSVDRVGLNYTLVAGASGLFADNSVGFDVRVGPPAQLAFTASPTGNVTSGSAFTARVAVRDAGGNVVTGTPTQVTLSLINAPGAILSGTTTATTVNGVATFSGLSVDKAGSGYMLQADATGLPAASSPAFGVAAGAPTALAFTGQPGNSTAGAAIAPAVSVTVRDANGNTVTASSMSITLALSTNPSGGTLAGTLSAAAVNGVATFGDLSIARAGTGYTITASSGTLTSATSSAFDITAGVATQLVFRVGPSGTTAGATLGNVTVEFQDANGNRVNTTRNVTMSLQGGQGGTLGGTTTVAASAGVAMFSDLSIARAGTGYLLVAHADQAADATSSAFDISHGPAAALVFMVQPSNTPAGNSISPAVKVVLQDALGNVATSATDSVTLALGNNPRSGTLSGTRTVSAISGVATFSNLSIDKKGDGYTLVASSGALAGATSAAFNITNGRGAHLVFTTVPSQATAGEALPTIEVELKDELGNTFTESTESVVLSLGDNAAGGQLFGRATVGVSNGVAKFDGLTLRKAGNGYTLVASAPGFESATSTALSVRPAAAASYALTFPASVTAGQEATLSAMAYDAYGNQAATYGGTVNVTSSDTGATLSSTATFAEGQLASFKVTFKTAGLRTLTVTDSANASLKATAQLNVTPFAQPMVKVTEPVGGTNVSGQVRVSAEGVVAAGTTVANLQILVDGKEVASGTDATVSGNWDSEKAEGGSHVITAIVTDGAGNIVSSAPVIIFTETGCGCGATTGTDASIYLALLVLARYVLGRRRKADAA